MHQQQPSPPRPAASRPAALADLQRQGQQVDFLFYYGHRPRGNSGGPGPWCLSQWFPASFTAHGARFLTAEHYMMWRKARLFGDEPSAGRILAAADPGAAKRLGRRVRAFDEQRWADHRSQIVVDGNYHKFTQHPALGGYLLHTGERVLVEASPHDRIWGIGLAASDPRAKKPEAWPGLNLLGFALMDVRAAIAAEGP